RRSSDLPGPGLFSTEFAGHEVKSLARLEPGGCIEPLRTTIGPRHFQVYCMYAQPYHFAFDCLQGAAAKTPGARRLFYEKFVQEGVAATELDRVAKAYCDISHRLTSIEYQPDAAEVFIG